MGPRPQPKGLRRAKLGYLPYGLPAEHVRSRQKAVQSTEQCATSSTPSGQAHKSPGSQQRVSLADVWDGTIELLSWIAPDLASHYATSQVVRLLLLQRPQRPLQCSLFGTPTSKKASVSFPRDATASLTKLKTPASPQTGEGGQDCLQRTSAIRPSKSSQLCSQRSVSSPSAKC